MFSFLKPVLNFVKKAFLVIAIYFIVISLFAYFISKDKVSFHSQVNPIEKNRQEIYKVIKDPQLNKTKEGKLAIVFYRTAMCGMIGEACTDNPKDGDKNFDKSAFGFITKLIVFPYVNPPASGVYWAYSGLQSAGFIPKTFAAEGIGFAAIKPFSNLWKIFRDLSYMLLVLVLISIGFMVMFRMKMNPQTVISVESALPKIVVSLILITFSFAIAGFLIDLMYASIILIISIFSNNNQFYNSTKYQNNFIASDFGSLVKSVAVGFNIFNPGGIAPVIGNAILGVVPITISYVLRGLLGFVLTVWVGNLIAPTTVYSISQAIDDIAGGTFSWGKIWSGIITNPFFYIFLIILFALSSTLLFDLLLFVLIGGTILFTAIRIFTILFISYLKLILLIIISPFLLLFEAVPGKNVFSWWVKNLLGYLIAFPITIAIFLLGYIVVNSSVTAGYSNIRLPFLYGFDTNSFKILVGTGLIFLIPDLIKLTKEALGIKDLPINLGIGTFFGGAGAVVGGGMGLISQIGSFMLGAQYLPIIGDKIKGTSRKTADTSGTNPPPWAVNFMEEIKKGFK